MEDILHGVAVAHGLIDYERLAHRVGLQANHMTLEGPHRDARALHHVIADLGLIRQSRVGA
jgi:hypothetical protein